MAQLDRPAALVMIGVEALTAVLLVLATWLSLLSEPHWGTDFWRLALLSVLSVGYTEATTRIGRLTAWLNLNGAARIVQGSVLLLTGVLVLPLWAAVTLMFVYDTHLRWCGTGKPSLPLYRWVWTVTTVALGTVSASAVLHGLGGSLIDVRLPDLGITLLAVFVYSGVNLLVLLVGMYLAMRPPSFVSLLPDSSQVGYEAAKLALGLVAAVLLIHTPLLTPIVLVLTGVLHRSTLVGQLHREASTDAKTGLLTYKAWLDQAVTHLATCDLNRTPAVAMLVDLDHFKQVNDSHGHQAGDAVLAAVGEIIRHELRDADAVGRFGGEEFVAFLGEVDETAGREIAERIRRRVEEESFGNGLTVTASVGLAEHPPGNRAVDTMLADADAAMYQAKRDGRNRVRTASDLEPSDELAGPLDDGAVAGALSRFSRPRRKSAAKVRNH